MAFLYKNLKVEKNVSKVVLIEKDKLSSHISNTNVLFLIKIYFLIFLVVLL